MRAHDGGAVSAPFAQILRSSSAMVIEFLSSINGRVHYLSDPYRCSIPCRFRFNGLPSMVVRRLSATHATKAIREADRNDGPKDDCDSEIDAIAISIIKLAEPETV
jgi:hypothetical protein